MSVTISTYLDDGRVYEYDVPDETKAREHTHAIVLTGYRHCGDGFLEHYPPHRILKVKAYPVVSTMFPDRTRGT